MLRRLLEQTFFPVGILGSFGLLMAVSVFFDDAVAIRGSYVVIGMTLAAMLYYLYSPEGGEFNTTPTRRTRYRSPKVVFTVVALGVVGTVLTGNRAVWVFLMLLIGYSLFVRQFVQGMSARVLLPQLFALFSLSPMTKYLSHGFYFGNSDTLFHVRNVEAITRAGTVAAISGFGAQYQWFPGYHILASTISMVGSVDPYDVILLLGIVTYSVFLISIVVLLGRLTTGDTDLSVAMGLGVAGVHTFAFTSTYFFPQAFALFPLVLLLYLTYRIADASHRRESRPLFVLVVVILTSLTFVHHLSFVFFAPALLFLAGLSAGSSWFSVPLSARNPGRAAIVLVLILFVPVSYWIYRADFFIVAVAVEMTAAIENSQLLGQAGTSSSSSVLTYGDVSVREGTGWALRALASPDGLYLILLMTVFAIGVAVVITSNEWWRRRVPLEFALLGVAASAVVFKTPFAFHYVVRFRYSMAVFFVVVVGLGIYYAVTASREQLHSSKGRWRSRLRATVPVLVVVGLLVVSPLQPIAGDDLYGLFPLHQKQVEYTEQEYESAAAVTEFVMDNQGDLTTLWIDRSTVERFRGDAPGRVDATRERISVPTDLFMYRDRWPDHYVLFRAEGRKLDKMLFERAWFERQVVTHNKVYSSGDRGLLWGDTGIELRQT